MLIPAIVKKEEILNAFKTHYYTTDMMYETGGLYNWLPEIADNPDIGVFQYAVVSEKDNKLIGYIAYTVDWYSSTASRFGIFSFDRGNITMGKDLFNELEKLIHEYKLHRIEWRMVGGNPVERSYDKFCQKYNGKKHILTDAFKDKFGKYHDDIIYEIIIDKENDNGK